MPHQPRSLDEQVRVIRVELRRLERGGPLDRGDTASASAVSDRDIADVIDPDKPWPVNFKTVVESLLPHLEPEDVRRNV